VVRGKGGAGGVDVAAEVGDGEPGGGEGVVIREMTVLVGVGDLVPVDVVGRGGDAGREDEEGGGPDGRAYR
jgi:hypothetical protein